MSSYFFRFFICSFLFLLVLTNAHAGSALQQKRSWNSQWDQFILEARLAETLSPTPADVQEVCPNYKILSTTEKDQFWLAFFQGLSYVESSWNTRARYVETTMGKDMVTGKQIVSEGLLQLSYQDLKIYGCNFDWAHDQPLDAADPYHSEKTIFDPARNLRCGMIIFKRIVARRGVIFTRSYWAPLLESRSNRAYRAFMDYIQSHTEMCR